MEKRDSSRVRLGIFLDVTVPTGSVSDFPSNTIIYIYNIGGLTLIFK